MHEPPDTGFGICTRARSMLARADRPHVLATMRNGERLMGALVEVDRQNEWIRVDGRTLVCGLMARLEYLNGGQEALDV